VRLRGHIAFLKRFADRSQYVNVTKKLTEYRSCFFDKEEKAARKKVYEALKRAQEVYGERHTFNTMIAGVMEAMNALNEQNNRDVWTEGYWILTSVMEPIVPHICWELSTEFFGGKNFGVQVVREEVFEVDSTSSWRFDQR
jgi:leucyl-tRNA synthetase